MIRTAEQSQLNSKTVQSVMHGIRDSLFATYRELNRDGATAHRSIGVRLGAALLIIQALQVLSFAILPVFSFPWSSSYIAWLRSVALWVRIDVVIVGDSLTQQAPAALVHVLAALVLTWLCGFIATSIMLQRQRKESACRSGTRGSASDDPSSKQKAAPRRLTVHLDLMRWAASLATSIALIPMLGLLLSPLRCLLHSSAQDASRAALQPACASESVAAAVTGAIAATVLVLLCLGHTIFYMARQGGAAQTVPLALQSSDQQVLLASNRQSAFARSHSRTELVVLCLRVALTVVFTLTPADTGSVHWALCAVYVGAVSLCAFVLTSTMPNHHHIVCQLNIVLSWLLVLSGVALVLTLAYDDPKVPVGVMVLYMGAPACAALAVLASRHIQQSLLLSPESAALQQSELVIDLKVRLMLQEMSSLHSSSIDEPEEPLARRLDSSHRRSTAPSQTERHRDRASEAQARFGGSMTSNERTSDALKRDGVYRDVRGGAAEVMLDRVESLLRTACNAHPSSALLCITMARFYRDNRFNLQLHAQLLVEAQKRQPALDQQFQLYCYQQELDGLYTAVQSADASADGVIGDQMRLSDSCSTTVTGATVALYVTYQSKLLQATQAMEVAIQSQHRFWTELMQPEPEVDKLMQAGSV